MYQDSGKIKKWTAVRLFLVVLAAGILVLAFWNQHQLNNRLLEHTRQYVHEVSWQTAALLDQQITGKTEDLKTIADNIVRMPESQIEEHLKRKAGLLGFEDLALADALGKGTLLNGEALDFTAFSSYRNALQGQASVSALDGERLIYATPVYQNDHIAGVLSGIGKKERLRELMEQKAFGGKGLTLLINREGEIVVSSLEKEPCKNVLELAEEETELQELLDRLEADTAHEESGFVTFSSRETGKEALLGYIPMETYDWYLLSIVPQDLLSHDIVPYGRRSLALLAAVLVAGGLLGRLLLKKQRQSQSRMKENLFLDPLTGGMSNVAFEVEAEKRIQEGPEGFYAMAAFDIQEFRILNEVYSKQDGDAVLCYIYQVMKKNLKEQELIARDRADLFYLLLRNGKAELLVRRLKKILEEINSFNQSRKIPYELKLNIGIFQITDKTMDITAIQDRANLARKSKQPESCSCVFYDQVERERMEMEKEFTSRMDTSLQNGEFQVYLQPKVKLENLKIVGAEALIRWEHPVRGFIFPADFIPAFEKNSMICRLDLFVFEQVCALLSRWRQEGREPLAVSVNLSSQHLKRENFLEDFLELLEKYQVPAEYVEMEFTESIIFKDPDVVKEVIGKIHAAGFRCSLDDFGYGYSAPGTFKSLDVDTLKMDRSLFVGDGNTKRGQQVVESFVDLTNKLEIGTVAEGIETEEQIAFLKRVDCEVVQGYVFSRALPIAEFEKFAYDGKVLKHLQKAEAKSEK